MTTTATTEDAAHVLPGFRFLLELEPIARYASLDVPRWIGYPRAARVLDELQARLLSARAGAPSSLLIVSEPDNGTTTLLTRFAMLCGDGYVGATSAINPVVFVDAPELASERNLLDAISWRPAASPDIPIALRRSQVIDELRRSETRLLVVDRLDHLVAAASLCNAGHDSRRPSALEVLLGLCGKLGLGLVATAHPSTLDTLNSLPLRNNTTSGFGVLSLPTWSLNADFERLLAGFEGVLALKQPSRLSHPDMAARLHRLSQGRIGPLKNVIQSAARAAIEHGHERITKQLLNDVLASPKGGGA